MEAFLAILMVLGIYVGVPLAIGFTIAGIVILGSRRATRAKRARAAAEEAEVSTRELART